MIKDVRPTSGRVIAALFSILGDSVINSRFLDLFAGTGRVGLEALNRGASSCVFVESIKPRADLIRKHNNSNSLVLALEVRRALSWLVKRNLKFDIIFADPPYNSGWCCELPKLGLERVLSDNALLVIEHSIRENIAHEQINMQKEYGETCLTFIKRSVNLE